MQPPTDVEQQAAAPEPKPAKVIPAEDALPPVEAPTMTFVTQLFLVPLLIVSIIVVLLVGVRWLVSVGSDPEKYVEDLQHPSKGSWQSAASLADMLRNPRNDALKRDSALAKRLAEVLSKQIEDGAMGEEDIKLRMFLSRALGEFHVTDGLPVLIFAAETERDPQEAVVRRTAIEAIAVLADNTDPTLLLDDPKLLPALRKAAHERSASGADDQQTRDDLRARAAFTLGVLGGEKALDELAVICSDGHPNARFNAATGLARNGDMRAERVLVQMLDPADEDVVRGEDPDEPSGVAWKRALVMINALEAVERLAEQNSDADFSKLKRAVDNLVTAELDPLIADRIRTQARELQIRLEERRTY